MDHARRDRRANVDPDLGTGVTCPIIRTHPAVIAQAAATTAALAGDRFWLGLGTGERLNEHVVGAPWPPFDVRQEMLEEAVDVIRQLWTGDEVDHHGQYFDVENARLYTRPDEPPPIMVAASGPVAAASAGRVGDGTDLDFAGSQIVARYRKRRRPRPARRSASSPSAGRHRRRRPVHGPGVVADRGAPRSRLAGAGPPGGLRGPDADVSEDQVASSVVCGPDPQNYPAAVEGFEKAGFDHVYLHQVGPDQAGFINFAKTHLL